jgi:hypothetical protein
MRHFCCFRHLKLDAFQSMGGMLITLILTSYLYCLHTTIIVNSSQKLSISVQVDNGITSLLASYIVTSWDRHVTWLPTDPRPLGRMCLGRTRWVFFLWWPSNRHQRVEDQEPVKSSLVSECWIWCMWPIISICSPWRNLQEDEVSFTCISWGFLVSSCWIWCMWLIISIHSQCSTSSLLWKQNWQRQSKFHILHFNGMTFLLLKLDLDLICYMVDESYVMCILHVFTNSIEAN